MKWLLSSAALLFLVACSPQVDKIYTVDELMADDGLLARIIGECRNNPGELRDTPNCRNAEAADGKLRLERMGKSLGG
ncbi:hypothetical protein ATY76_31530 [Rhizobium sp. R339]|uniref:EexN family lipoprotein n=1 Tax=Rhizobium sp. R339 TaxID=1764273 RepID=UPI000B52F7E7|nr:EexN family lipoprotein [Rhizobium sp. R339]OWV71185.1 hypothetical protein ATY76_31530 [Rhizobium sp. R339]